MRDLMTGKTVKIIVPESPFFDEEYGIHFNSDMIEALKRNPEVHIEGVYVNDEALTEKRKYRLRARFCDGNKWYIIPRWIVEDTFTLFLD